MQSVAKRPVIAEHKLPMRPGDLRSQNRIVFRLNFPLRFRGWEEREAVKASRFLDAPKAFILKQGSLRAMTQIPCRGVTERREGNGLHGPAAGGMVRAALDGAAPPAISR